MHIGIQSILSETLDYLSNILSLPSEKVLIENNSNSRGETDCRHILPQRDIDYLTLANSYDWALINLLFGRDNSELRSCCKDSLEKQKFLHSTIQSSILNLSSHLRVINT